MILNEKTQFDVFIKGTEVDLIGLTDEMASNSNWYKWFNDEETTQHMQKHYYPNSESLQIQYLNDDIQGNPKRLQLGILHKADQVFIGVISLANIDYLNRKCEVSGLIGEKKYKGITFWVEANRLLMAHAVNTLNIHRIYGGAISKEVAVFYERILGFKLEGVLEKHVFKNGSFRDVYLFGRIFEPPYK